MRQRRQPKCRIRRGVPPAPRFHIITSFPSLGESTGARVLAEIGDDRRCFADARGLKAFAGSAPITRASGRSTSITHRRG
jgi:transposase